MKSHNSLYFSKEQQTELYVWRFCLSLEIMEERLNDESFIEFNDKLIPGLQCGL